MPSEVDRLPDVEEVLRARAAADHFQAKLLVSFGGFGRSQGFALMASTKKRRKIFLNALNAIFQEYKLDGVDYNWEYPTSAKEWGDLALLMKESKAVLSYGILMLTKNAQIFDYISMYVFIIILMCMNICAYDWCRYVQIASRYSYIHTHEYVIILSLWYI